MSFQVANYFQEIGYKKADVVALAMTNRPEVACIWLGLCRLGVITSIINYNLRGDPFQHCLTVSKSKGIIIGSELKDSFKEVWNAQNKTPVYELDRYNVFTGSHSNFSNHDDSSLKIQNLAKCLQKTSSKPIKLLPHEEPNFEDNIFYIFTSGTTGHPKQAKISHFRYSYLSGTGAILKPTASDKLHNCMPMYHMAANLGVIWAFNGIPCVIARKFSASRFCKYECTIILYIGEILRFILKQPHHELERKHKLRAIFGVGAKPEVWRSFVERFGIPQIAENCGATEGNCTLLNLEGTKVGAVVYLPIWLQPIYPGQLVKVDPITGEIIRDRKTGFAIKCDVAEEGEMIGKILNFLPSGKFEGYTNEAATEEKIARDVFRKGDKYFRSGDIFCRDSHGYFYFKDRAGDTFRRRGENVATTEVENVILKLTGMRNNVVYGVTIPGVEGGFGMLAILDVDGSLDLQELQRGMEASLPNYARTLFIRCVQNENAFQMTGTFKLQKFYWVKEGFNLEQVTDPIYVFCYDSNSYRRLDSEIYKEILKGNFRL